MTARSLQDAARDVLRSRNDTGYGTIVYKLALNALSAALAAEAAPPTLSPQPRIDEDDGLPDCGACHGIGMVETGRCTECNGTGLLQQPKRAIAPCLGCGTQQYAADPCPVCHPPPTRYDANQIAWELDQTALGAAHYGNALRVAKDLPQVTDTDRAMLDKWACGRQTGTDHIALQDIAIRIRSTDQHPTRAELVVALRECVAELGDYDAPRDPLDSHNVRMGNAIALLAKYDAAGGA